MVFLNAFFFFFFNVMYLMKCWVMLSSCGIWVHDGVWWAWQGGPRAGDELVQGAVHVSNACCEVVGHQLSGPATGDTHEEWAIS